jgi:DNA-binding NarL/FixJ family response regulator
LACWGRTLAASFVGGRRTSTVHHPGRVAATAFRTRTIAVPTRRTTAARLGTTTLPRYAANRKNAKGAADENENINDGNTRSIAEFGAKRRDPQWQERSQHWILLVDDEEDLRLAVGQYLDDQGYQVTACADAATALAMARQRRPSLIISDVRMPGGMDGLDFLQTVRADSALVDLPVVLLTARGQTRDRIAGYNAGADAYIPKPFEPTELVSVLDNLLARQKLISDSAVNVEDLQRAMTDIKHLLLEKGGGGAGVGGFVEATNVFLAPDERQVLDYLCQGLPNKEIAAASFLSTRRVEQLLTSLYRKTDVSNRTELVRWAVRTGTIRL